MISSYDRNNLRKIEKELINSSSKKKELINIENVRVKGKIGLIEDSFDL